MNCSCSDIGDGHRAASAQVEGKNSASRTKPKQAGHWNCPTWNFNLNFLTILKNIKDQVFRGMGSRESSDSPNTGSVPTASSHCRKSGKGDASETAGWKRLARAKPREGGAGKQGKHEAGLEGAVLRSDPGRCLSLQVSAAQAMLPT